MDRIVQSYIDDFLKSQQIGEKDSSKQFEMFSSYCAVAQQYTELFDLNDVLTGAGGDCGFDSNISGVVVKLYSINLNLEVDYDY